MPTERRFDITAFFKSYSSEILERFHPLGNPVVKLAILFRSQIGSSWRLGSLKLTVYNFIAAIWFIVFGQVHYNSIWVLTMLYLPDSTVYFFCYHPYGCKFYLVFYFFGFAVAIGKWASISLFLLVSMMISCHGQFQRYSRSKFVTNWNPSNAWSQKIESKKLTRPTITDFSTVPTVRYPYFFPHTKLFEETDGYFRNGTMYIEISFFDPPIPPTQSSLLFPFP